MATAAASRRSMTQTERTLVSNRRISQYDTSRFLENYLPFPLNLKRTKELHAKLRYAMATFLHKTLRRPTHGGPRWNQGDPRAKAEPFLLPVHSDSHRRYWIGCSFAAGEMPGVELPAYLAKAINCSRFFAIRRRTSSKAANHLGVEQWQEIVKYYHHSRPCAPRLLIDWFQYS